MRHVFKPILTTLDARNHRGHLGPNHRLRHEGPAKHLALVDPSSRPWSDARGKSQSSDRNLLQYVLDNQTLQDNRTRAYHPTLMVKVSILDTC